MEGGGRAVCGLSLTLSLPSSFSISVYQCLVVLMPSHCGAGQRRTRPSAEPAGPAGPAGRTCRTISPQLPFYQSRRNKPVSGEQQKYLSALAARTFSELRLLQKWCQSTVNIVKHTHTHTQSSVLFNHIPWSRGLQVQKPAPNPEKDP